MQETQVPPLSREDPLEKAMGTNSNILAGESHGQRSLVLHSQTLLKQLSTAPCVEQCVIERGAPDLIGWVQRQEYFIIFFSLFKKIYLLI